MKQALQIFACVLRGCAAIINYTFKKGEVRKFEFRVCNNIENESIIIQSATWRVTGRDKQDADSGSCTVSEDYVISMVVPLLNEGDFVLEVTAQIPPEIIKERFGIRVVE